MRPFVLMVRLIALALAVAVAATGCMGIRQAAELDPEEKGAACITVVAASINPFVNGETRAAILEINTGDPNQVIDPEIIQATAEAMGCR